MRTLRFAAAIASIGVSLTVPTGALGAGSTTTTSSQITPTAPSRLTTTTASVTTTSTLPNTGFDLLPETVLGGVLVGAGVALRLRRSRA